MIQPAKLDFWFKNNFNVLFIGKHGVGKTALVNDCFVNRNGLVLGESFLYFSTPTLDPWVDFVGVPKEVKDENGITYLDLVRPK
ncbi:MAG: ATP-binding protein, partial [Rhabdochlamydiaceae bacterium]